MNPTLSDVPETMLWTRDSRANEAKRPFVRFAEAT